MVRARTLNSFLAGAKCRAHHQLNVSSSRTGQALETFANTVARSCIVKLPSAKGLSCEENGLTEQAGKNYWL